jgi:hypothetical protein
MELLYIQSNTVQKTNTIEETGNFCILHPSSVYIQVMI